MQELILLYDVKGSPFHGAEEQNEQQNGILYFTEYLVFSEAICNSPCCTFVLSFQKINLLSSMNFLNLLYVTRS